MNKKIKVIELLNKKANNEQMPSKIRFEGLNYQYKGSSYYDRDGDLLCENCDLLCVLDSKVEILEDEEIEEIKVDDNNYIVTDNGTNLKGRAIDITFVNKINEIIDKVNKLDKKINKED